MAKRKKSPEGRELAQLESDREWLVRTTLIGMGYLKSALDNADDPTEQQLIRTHRAEMERAIDGCRPAAEDALQRLGKRVHGLTVTANMVPKLVAAARVLIEENERTAESSHGPGESGLDRWDQDDPENFEAVGDLRTWCDAIELKA